MFGMSIKPMEFTEALTAEEIAKAEAIKADHIAFVSSLNPLAIAGLSEPGEAEKELIESVADRQEALHKEIWDRVDPGAEKRTAHYAEQMKKAEEEFLSNLRASEGGEDLRSLFGSDGELRKPSLVDRVKSFFGR